MRIFREFRLACVVVAVSVFYALNGGANLQAQQGSPSVAVTSYAASTVTLSLESNTAGTGYFVLESGSNIACPSASQIAQGEDSNNQPLVHGSALLMAGQASNYTVENLTANTAYTVCFTPDGTTAPVTTSFTTQAMDAYTSPSWNLLGVALSQTTKYESLVFSPAGVPYLALSDGGNKGATAVYQYTNGAWSLVGSELGPYQGYEKLAFSPNGTLYVAYVDGNNSNKVTVQEYSNGKWTVVGTPQGQTVNGAAVQASDLSLAFAPDGTPYMAYTSGQYNGPEFVMEYTNGAWQEVGKSDSAISNADYGSIAFSPTGTLYLAYADRNNGNKVTVTTYTNGAWTQVGSAQGAGGTNFVSLSFSSAGIPYVAFNNYLPHLPNPTAAVVAYTDKAWSQLGTALGKNVRNGSLAIAPDGTPYLSYADSGQEAVLAYSNSSAAWTPLAAGGLSTDENTDSPTLTFSPSGTAYLAYSDAGNSGAATVVQLSTPLPTGSVATSAPTSVTSSSATLNGQITGYTASSTVRAQFEYGITTSYGTVVAATISASGGVTANVTGLNPNTEYYYRLDALVGSIVSSASQETFTTAKIFPVINTLPAATSLVMGQNLSYSTLLGGQASVPGTFAWTNPNTVMGTAGAQSESVTFTPTNTTQYATATGSVTVVVQATAPVATVSVGSTSASVATLSLTSNTTGTGYFVLESGSNTACPSASQIAQGEDSNNQPLVHGSALLTAGQASNYTVQNLTANTAYTVCFTPDGTTAPVTASFTTQAMDAYTSPSWNLLGLALSQTTKYESLVFSPAGVPYLAYSYSPGGATVVDQYINGSWSAVGGSFSAGQSYQKLAFSPNGTLYVAYVDGGNSNKATVQEYSNGKWTVVGTPQGQTVNGAAVQASDLSLAFAPDGTPYMAYTSGQYNGPEFVMEYTNGAWQEVGNSDSAISNADYASIAFSPTGTLYLAYADRNNGNKVTVATYTNGAWTQVGSAQGAGGTNFVSLSFSSAGTPYVAFNNYLGSNPTAAVVAYTNKAWSQLGAALGKNVRNGSLAIAPDGTPYLSYADSGQEAVLAYSSSSAAWTALSAVGLNADESTDSPTLTFSPSGTAYLAYSDASNNGAATVVQLSTAPAMSTTPASNITGSSATLNGTVASGGGNIAAQFEYGTTSSYGTIVPATISQGGVASAAISGLNPATTYFYRIDAIQGGITYPDTASTQSFTTTKGTPTITAWPTATSIILGSPLSDSLLSGGQASVPGTFSWSTPTTVMSTAGAESELVTFTPTNTTIYNPVTQNVTVQVETSAVVGTVSVANLSSSSATLNLTSPSSGTGYFVLESGSGATCGTAASIVSGLGASGNALIHGSVVLNAGVVSAYTVRNLAQNTQYLVCFTPDGASAPTSASLTTTKLIKYISPSWGLVGYAQHNYSRYQSLAFGADGTPYLAYSDGTNNNAATVMAYTNGAWGLVGKPQGSNTSYDVVAIAPNGTLYLAYADGANKNALTVMEYVDNAWTLVGAAQAQGASYLSLAVGPDGTPYVAYSIGQYSGPEHVMAYTSGAWSDVLGSPVSTNGSNGSLAFSPNGTLYFAYIDHSSGNKVQVTSYSGSSWTPSTAKGFGALLGTGYGNTLSLAIGPDGTPYVAFNSYVSSTSVPAEVMSYVNGAWSIVGTAQGANTGDVSLAIGPDGTPYLSYEDNNNSENVVTYTGGAWQNLGSGLNKDTDNKNMQSLAIAPNGTVYLTYEDGSNNGAASVLAYIGLVSQAAPTVYTWPTATPILSGQTLSMSTLNGGTASVDGEFSWTNPNTVLSAVGTQTESVTFTPSNADAYTTVTGTVSVQVLSASAPPTGSLSITNIGVNTATLVLSSSINSTGYFVLMPGNNATCGSVASIISGVDASGDALTHGSLALTANVAGNYTLRGLTQNSNYTVCFTPDGDIAPLSKNLDTPAMVTYSSPVWAQLGASQSSNTRYESLALAPNGTLYLAYADGNNKDAATVLAYVNGAWSLVGTPQSTNTSYESLGFSPNGTLYLAYSDGNNNGAATVIYDNSGTWTIAGTAQSKNTIYESLAFAPDGTPYLAYTSGSGSGMTYVTALEANTWAEVGNTAISTNASNDSLAFSPLGIPYLAYEDHNHGNSAAVVAYTKGAWTQVGTNQSAGTYSETLAFSSTGTPYLAYRALSGKAEIDAYLNGAWTIVGTQQGTNTYSETLAVAPDGTPYLSYKEGAQGGSAAVIAFSNGAWKQIGGYLGSQASSQSLVFSSTGIPYFAYEDNNYKNAAIVVQLSSQSAVTSVTLTASSAWVAPGQTLTLTAQVNSDGGAGMPTPTGSVSFYDGTTLLGSEALANGVATYSSSTLASGVVHNFTATYSGDSNYSGSSTSEPTTVSVGASTFTLGSQAGPGVVTTQTVKPGGTASFSFTVSPQGDGGYPGVVTFTASGLPAGATAAFSPASIAANGGAQTVIMIVQTGNTSAKNISPFEQIKPWGTGASILLGSLLLPLMNVKRVRKGWMKRGMLMLLLLAAGTLAASSLTGCSTNSASSIGSSKTYNITVTATSGSVKQSFNATLNIS